ncbi:MAG: hypothetical protein U9R68_05540 [Planctomycetota bacterium]|nr:hypothetical protein [Planctomycetota bacterium]
MALQFFRKHRKWFMILVFAAVISMVFWLAWREMAVKLSRWFGSRAGGQVVGHIAGREVTAGELGRFATDIRVAGRASEVWYRILAGRADAQDAAARIYQATLEESAWPILAQQLKDPEHIGRATAIAWLALYEEACRFGFATPAVEVDARLERLRSLGLTGQDIAGTVAREAHGRHEMLVQALRHDMTLAAYIRYLYEAFGVPVGPELRSAFARQDARIQVRMAVFKADDALDDAGKPPEDTLKEYFNKYKTHLPGKGPDGIGYRIPAKVAVEYLAVEPATFEDEVAETVTEEQVKAYYEDHKDTEFLIEQQEDEKDSEAEDEDDACEGKPDASSDEKPAEKQYRPLAEVRDAIRDRLVRREAEGLARNHLGGLVGEITTKQKGVDLRIWADGARVRYVRVPDLLTEDELAEVKGLGGATRDRTTVPQAALSVVELVGAEKARIAVGEISEVYTGTAGRAYAFRVTNVAPSREPKNLDEVRPAVAEDVRRAEAFRIVRERAKRILETAAEKGLQAAADQAEVETVTTDWFPRQHFIPYGGRWLTFPPTLPEAGSSPVLVAECFEMVQDGRERTLVTLGRKRMVVVAELVGRKAPREAAYERFRPLVAQRVARQMAGQALVDLLQTGSIQRRMAVVIDVPETEPKEGGRTTTDTGSGPEPPEPPAPPPDIGR